MVDSGDDDGVTYVARPWRLCLEFATRETEKRRFVDFNRRPARVSRFWMVLCPWSFRQVVVWEDQPGKMRMLGSPGLGDGGAWEAQST